MSGTAYDVNLVMADGYRSSSRVVTHEDTDLVKTLMGGLNGTALAHGAKHHKRIKDMPNSIVYTDDDANITGFATIIKVKGEA
jgi:hypothetical protein